MSCILLWCMLLAKVFNNVSIVWDIPLSCYYLLVCRLRLCNPWFLCFDVFDILLLNSLIAWRSNIVFYCEVYRLIELAPTLTHKDTYRSLAHLYFFCGFKIYLIFLTLIRGAQPTGRMTCSRQRGLLSISSLSSPGKSQLIKVPSHEICAPISPAQACTWYRDTGFSKISLILSRLRQTVDASVQNISNKGPNKKVLNPKCLFHFAKHIKFDALLRRWVFAKIGNSWLLNISIFAKTIFPLSRPLRENKSHSEKY